MMQRVIIKSTCHEIQHQGMQTGGNYNSNMLQSDHSCTNSSIWQHTFQSCNRFLKGKYFMCTWYCHKLDNVPTHASIAKVYGFPCLQWVTPLNVTCMVPAKWIVNPVQKGYRCVVGQSDVCIVRATRSMLYFGHCHVLWNVIQCIPDISWSLFSKQSMKDTYSSPVRVWYGCL